MTLDEARDNISAHVLYSSVPGECQEGVIDSVGRRYVYIRYMNGPDPKATPPELLTLMRGGSVKEHFRLNQEETPMTNGKVQCPTAHDALKQALTAILSDTGPGRLTDVSFGRYADLSAGWHWHADITRRLAMRGSKLDQEDESMERKVCQVVERWAADTARYQQDLTLKEEPRD